jgi:hypothetical protein
MAKWSFAIPTITMTAVADNASMTSGAYMALQNGSSTQMVDILEILMSGQAVSSAVAILLLGRDSTIGA